MSICRLQDTLRAGYPSTSTVPYSERAEFCSITRDIDFDRLPPGHPTYLHVVSCKTPNLSCNNRRNRLLLPHRLMLCYEDTNQFLTHLSCPKAPYILPISIVAHSSNPIFCKPLVRFRYAKLHVAATII